ncbi:hypothetical protein BDV23DRAFT_143790 [Aspergillus alliaceus]|uniref:Uncharacterized protein n=1 Tax=Petromyces alliaceus TaxID=209559 RepID=A0A5N7CPT3_PETAA|nr:hypothetical protein BDV23DRAFT_143790 [Aspergillus alliaceus]
MCRTLDAKRHTRRLNLVICAGPGQPSVPIQLMTFPRQEEYHVELPKLQTLNC